MNHGRRLSLTAAPILLGILLAAPASAGGSCKSRHFVIAGTVRDTAGKPLADASVFLLVDTVSEKKFNQHGMRTRRFRTDKSGRYQGEIDCDAVPRDEPNPCARKPKDLTVAANSSSYRLKLKTFKLKNLGVVENQGYCYVALPDLVLHPGF